MLGDFSSDGGSKETHQVLSAFPQPRSPRPHLPHRDADADHLEQCPTPISPTLTLSHQELHLLTHLIRVRVGQALARFIDPAVRELRVTLRPFTTLSLSSWD